MSALTVPEKDQKPMGELVDLSAKRLRAFMKALSVAPPKLLLRDLAQSVAEKSGMSRSEVLPILRLLTTLYALRNREGTDAATFSEDVCLALVKTGNPKLRLEGPRREAFKTILAQLMSFKSLFVSAKARDVMREHERVMCEARILTDMRAVFDEDEKPAAAVFVHMLKVRYHEGAWGPLHEFFVALSSENLRTLIGMLKRAERKETALKMVARQGGLPCLSNGDT